MGPAVGLSSSRVYCCKCKKKIITHIAVWIENIPVVCLGCSDSVWELPQSTCCWHCSLTLPDVELSSGEPIVVEDRTQDPHTSLHDLKMLLVVSENKANPSEGLHCPHASSNTAMNN